MRLLTTFTTLAAVGTTLAIDFSPRSLFTRGLWSSSETEIFLPFSPDWDDVTARWKANNAPTFQAVIQPGNEHDVQTAVKLANALHVPFIAIGGGHSFGFEPGFDGISINLGKFKDVNVDAATNTMTVGGSVTMGDILDPLYAAGKEFPIGSCTCPGIVGVALGAGIGRYQGIHGLETDSLVSARLITAAGDLITVSETENADLWWAIRGAGHNFGIVTEATFQVYDLSNNGNDVLAVDLIFPGSVNQSYFELMAYYNDNLPPNFTLFGGMMYDEAAGPVLSMSLVYVGPEAEALPLIQPFLDLGPMVQNTYLTPFNTLIQQALFGLDGPICEKGQVNSPAPVSMKTIDVPTFVNAFNTLADFWELNPAARGTGVLTEMMHPGKMMEVDENATAYPWRDVTQWVVVMASWTEEANEDDVVAFARSVRDDFVTTSGYPGLQIYVNYVNGDEDIEMIYGAHKLPQLAALKAQWDPNGVFNYYRPIPTSYP